MLTGMMGMTHEPKKPEPGILVPDPSSWLPPPTREELRRTLSDEQVEYVRALLNYRGEGPRPQRPAGLRP